MNPIIGITCFCNLGKRNTNETPYYRVSSNYIEPIIKCGGIPFIIPVFFDKYLTEKILNTIDGLFITGGSGGTTEGDRREIKERPRTLRALDEKRYIAEQYLAKAAMQRNIPL